MPVTSPHAQPTAVCLAELDASPEGLNVQEAERRLAEHGPNRLPEVRTRGPVVRFLVQFHNVLIYVLLGAAVVTGALQHWVDTGVILAVVLANAVIGFLQESKAERRWPRSVECSPHAPPCCATAGA
jgi:magnesium-transporting ATPase (P-type)